MNLYSVKDGFFEEFMPPFVAKNDKIAIFSYESWLKERPLKDKQVNRLYCLGSFCENTGVIVSSKPRLVEEFSTDIEEVKDNG